MDKKAILAKAAINLSVLNQNKNQIFDELNDFYVEELLEFREKILEQRDSIEATIEQNTAEATFFDTEVDQDEKQKQMRGEIALTQGASHFVSLKLPTNLY